MPQELEGTTLYQKLAPDKMFEREFGSDFERIPNRLPAAVLETYYTQLAIPEGVGGIGKLLIIIGTKFGTLLSPTASWWNFFTVSKAKTLQSFNL